ncbi:MAG: DUF4433 domain-containing protein [Candidatus Cyclonatronum sp.]|uniref:DUF4433 domain-containing protein n=1 Tax=Cyclonatronum sp. TaxID=3024185 RepID=UPI0025C3D90C|nr:DUF4433 domain-containing protein [Cyclonatronum sp.]MCH8488096.1 DUF4433 domain-containing protein [Cyclonatronum sp.]
MPHILRFGITHRNSPDRNPDFTPIGDSSLISARTYHMLPNGRQLADYIPFYFSSRMPMLYVIQNGFNGVPAISPELIVYCISSVGKVIAYDLDYIFTDGHAVDSFSSVFRKEDTPRIKQLLDFEAIRARYWKDDNDLDKKRRKEAEFLVLSDLPAVAILGFVVYNN